MIKLILGFFAKILFNFSDQLKGHRLFEDKVTTLNDHTTVEITSTDGFCLTITVTRHVYQEHYSSRFFKMKKHRLYSVHGIASPDAPDSLKKAVANEVSFPPLLPWFFTEELQRRYAVRAYVQIVRKRVMNFRN